MSEIVIHIGTHKTATTTIQDTLFHNRASLTAHGIIYPDIGKATGHHTLATHWIELPQVYYDRKPAEAHWNAIAENHAGEDVTVLLSSEEFSRGRPQSVDFRELARLTAPFDRRRVICLLRNQVGFIQSVYLEIAKKRRTLAFDQYFNQSLANFYAAGLYLDYALLHDRLLEGFAPEEIVFLSYDDLQRKEEGFIRAFLGALGLDMPPEALSALPNGGSNISPDALALWAANQVAAPEIAGPRLIALTQEAIARYFEGKGKSGRTTLYTPGQVSRLEALFGPANRAFLDRYGRRDLDIPFPAMPDTMIYRSDLDTPFWVHLARVLNRRLEAAERVHPA